ncbi:hypothetical protein EOD42_23380 [Rhodovarius crocodyli]|uniref:Uncharacterized protein n=1 Tax=Rhodovarius crocodyli TaxID=1979269 RepID=A0A437LZC6_9PROT|nr:hypothetical protein [Rhodovarius crocodyli]RVT90747.1 hypothetical protein EOD42_23380 [Rhodovarius crocodyli]
MPAAEVQRAVYALPLDLHQEIRAYMAQCGLRNETEAVRRLLRLALSTSEKPEALAQRLAREIRTLGLRPAFSAVLACHPLFTEARFFDAERALVFKTTNGAMFRVSAGRVEPVQKEASE